MDIDGTLTDKQRRWAEPNHDTINKVKQMIADGYNVVVWSGSGHYARRFCKKYGIKPFLCIGKPDLVVDNQAEIRNSRRMPILTPKQFLEKDFPKR